MQVWGLPRRLEELRGGCFCLEGPAEPFTVIFWGYGAEQMRNCPPYTRGCTWATPSFIPSRPSSPSPQGRGSFPALPARSLGIPLRRELHSVPYHYSKLWKMPFGRTDLQLEGHRAERAAPWLSKPRRYFHPPSKGGGEQQDKSLPSLHLGGCPTRCLANARGWR